MPYFRCVRHEGTIPVTGIVTSTGANYSTPYSVVSKGSHDISFRTREPSGDLVETIDRSTIEPYSWFMDNQKLKVRALQKNEARFDPSLFREDRGHAWDNRKWLFTGGLDFTWRSTGGTNIRYSGTAIQTSLGKGLIPPPPPTDLESQAAVWYGRMAPVVGEFSLSTFLGELREGLPRLLPDIISRANFARSAGSDYLNVQFGWEPLLSDLRKLTEILLSASYGMYKPLGAYHRRRDLRPVTTWSRTDLSNSRATLQTGNYLSGLNLIPSDVSGAGTTLFDVWGAVTEKTSLTRWYEGEFVYIPKASFDPSNYLDRVETLLDPGITPAVLWELTPWSWLTDWFLQIGGAISAMEAGIDNRILSTYFYAMEEFTSSTEITVTRMRLRSGTSPALPSFYRQRSEFHQKRRVRGNPFGFTGVSSSPLNVGQLGILGALGLTKTR